MFEHAIKNVSIKMTPFIQPLLHRIAILFMGAPVIRCLFLPNFLVENVKSGEMKSPATFKENIIFLPLSPVVNLQTY